jgi:class 3 adenylate cyclase
LVNVAGDETFSVFATPDAAIDCARVTCARAQRDLAITVRTGVHTGDLLSTGGDFVGMTVHIGARISRLARAGEVLVSHTVRDLAACTGSRFTPRGRHVLKGVPGESQLFALDVHAPGIEGENSSARPVGTARSCS